MEKREYLYKLLIVGGSAVGCSSIVERYVHNYFTYCYKATIGVDFAMKVLNWDQNTIVRLQLWDIAGHERFLQFNKVYYKGASGCIVVYDITRPDTLEAAEKWKDEIDKKVQLPDGKPIPYVLFANKCDYIPREEIAKEASRINSYRKKKGFIGWFATSAKENVNIENAVKFLVNEILDHEHSPVEVPCLEGKNSIEMVYLGGSR